MALTISVDEIVHGSRSPLLAVRPHWKRIRLREIASVQNGCAFDSAQFTKSDGTPLIRIRDVGSDSTDTNYVGEFDARYVVEPGDLLVGMDGDFKCARWRGPRALLNQRVCRVALHSSMLHPRFLDFALPGYLQAINEATSSVTVKHLSSRTIEDIPLPLPPLHEQADIVAELETQFSRLDEAVANLKRARRNITEMRRAVLDAAALGGLLIQRSDDGLSGEERVSRIVGSRRLKWAGTNRYKEPVAPDPELVLEVPRHWAKLAWEAILLPEDGAFKRGPFGSSLTKAMFVDKGYKVYEQYCPINDDCSFARYFVEPAKFEEMKEFAVRGGDFLISCSGVTLGRITRVPDQFAQGIINQALLRVRVDPEVVDPAFFQIVFRSPTFQGFLVERSAGAAIPNLRGVGQLKAIPVPVPPLSEQQEIVAEVDRRLSIVREVEAEVDASLKRAQALRQAVLAKAFAQPGLSHPKPDDDD
jgi:type I restriction enzyme S subunit